jgi:DNA-binding transcriptional MerR regulator
LLFTDGTIPRHMPESHPHRMRDLVRLTSIPAPTIHFYGMQGLLPPPHKTCGNQARYADETVQRVVWIRTLQQDLHLPLKTIRWVLERWGELPVDEIRALQALGTLMEEPDPVATADELAHGLEALEPTDLDDMRAIGLVAPKGQPLTSSDARLIELVGAIRAAGLTTEAGFIAANLALYSDAVERLADEELRRIIEPALSRNTTADLHELVKRGLPLAHQLLALLHQRAVQAQLQRWLENHDAEAARATA